MPFKAGAIVGEAILDTKKWNTSVTGIEASFSSIKRAGEAAAIAIAGYMTASTIRANTFKIEMSNVSTVLDTAVDSTQDMTKALLDLDPKLGDTIELTKALYLAFSAGAEDQEDAMQTTVDSAKFAAAALTDAATALDVLTTAENAYGEAVVDTTKASDIFFKTIEEGKITGEQLAAVIGQSIPLYASAGVELEQLGSGLAALTKQGASASESTTQLNAIIKDVLRPTEALAAAMESYGYATGGAFLEAEGLTGVLKLVEEVSKGNVDVTSDLFDNIRALRGILALTGEGGEIYADVLGKMELAAGATDIAFAKQERTWVALRNELNKIGIVTGNIVKYFVDDLVVAATEASTNVLQFISSAQGMELVGNIAGFTAGAFALAKDALAGLGSIVEDYDIPTLLFGIAASSEDAAEGFFSLGTFVDAAAFTLQVFVIAIQDAYEKTNSFVNLSAKQWAFLNAQTKLIRNAFSKDREQYQGEAAQAFADMISAQRDHLITLTSGTKDTIAEVKNLFMSYINGSESVSKDIEVSFSTAFENTKDNVLANWLEIFLGQKQTVVKMEKDWRDYLSEAEDAGRDYVVSTEKYNKSIEEDTEDTIKSLEDLWKEYFDNMEFSWEGAAGAVGDILDTAYSGWSDISSLYYDTEENKIDAWEYDQLQTLENTYNAGLLTEEEYEAQKLLIEEEANAERNELGKKQFENEQALSIAEVWMDAASAIAGFWGAAASLGPIAGPIFGGVMSAAMLAMAGTQTSLISQQTYIPEYAVGGTTNGGMARINERGGEIVNLPDGSLVIPNDISRQIATDVGKDSDKTVNIYNPTVRSDQDINKIVSQVSYALGKQLRRA